MKLISKEEAVIEGVKKYFTGKPCRHGHLTFRYVSCDDCCECSRLSRKKYTDKNRDAVYDMNKRWRTANKDKTVSYKKKYNTENIESIRLYRKKYYSQNREKVLEASKKWRNSNPKRCSEITFLRYKLEKSLTPPRPYHNTKAISYLRNEVKRLNLLKKGRYEVDHIWPISRGGVNHACNMRIVESTKNKEKGSSHDGEAGVSYEDFMLAVTAYA